jgi:uncharacterized membrane protein YgcG
MSTFDAIDDGLRAGILHTVVTRVAVEPRPTPSRAFVAALRRASVRDAFCALATAWHLATLRDRPVAFGARVRAAGLAIGVGGLLASSGAVALASVAGVAGEMAAHLSTPALVEPERPAPRFTASPRPRPAVAPPAGHASASPVPAQAEPNPAATPSPKPTRSPRPTSAPGDTGDGHDGAGGAPRPTTSPVVGGSGGGSGGGGDRGEGGGSGGSGAHASPTPEPTEAPEHSAGNSSGGG